MKYTVGSSGMSVFSTKQRAPSIAAEWRDSLHHYLGGIVNGLDGQTEGVCGAADHVHLLVGLKATHCLADFMRELKKASSIWVKDHHDTSFAWQEGYAAFTVSPTARMDVKAYIAHQDDHHRQRSFREVLVEMLNRAGVAFDMKYLD